MYTLQTLKEANPHREHLIDDSMLKKINKILEFLSPGEEIKPGDVIKYTDEGGGFCDKAFISNETVDDKVYICENASPHVFLKCDSLGFSVSGGPWHYIPKDKLKKIGTTKKVFWTWGNMGAIANGGIHFEADVNYWEYNVNKSKYSEESHDIAFINYIFKDSQWIITEFHNSVHSRYIKENELIRFLNLNKAELEIKEDKIIAWTYKEKNILYREEDEIREYEKLDLPEYIMYSNSSYLKCKVEYKDTTKFLHKAYEKINGCGYFGIEVDIAHAIKYNKENETSEKYSILLEKFKRGKDDHAVWKYQESVYIETGEEFLLLLRKGEEFLVHEIKLKSDDGVISSIDFKTSESLIFFLRKKLLKAKKIKKVKIHDSFKNIIEEAFEGTEIKGDGQCL